MTGDSTPLSLLLLLVGVAVAGLFVFVPVCMRREHVKQLQEERKAH